VKTKARPEIPGPDPGQTTGTWRFLRKRWSSAGAPLHHWFGDDAGRQSGTRGRAICGCGSYDGSVHDGGCDDKFAVRPRARQGERKRVDGPIGSLELERQLARRETWPAETSSFVILFAKQPVLFALMRTTWFESSLATLVPSIERNIVASPDCARFGNADRTVWRPDIRHFLKDSLAFETLLHTLPYSDALESRPIRIHWPSAVPWT
jgi:hypothetical protein